MSVIQLSVKKLQEKLQNNEPLFLLDVREPHEFKFAHIEGSYLIPMNDIAQRVNEIETNIPCIVICHYGRRSQIIANFLVDEAGLSNIYNLSGGIDAWSEECDSTVARY